MERDREQVLMQQRGEEARRIDSSGVVTSQKFRKRERLTPNPCARQGERLYIPCCDQEGKVVGM